MNFNTQKLANWQLVAICIALTLAAFLIRPAKAQTFTPFNYWTFENSNPLKDSMNVSNLDPNYYQTTYAINNNSPGVGVGKHLTLNTNTTGLVKAGIFAIDSAFTVEFLFRPGQGFNATNFFGRFDGAMGARMEYPTIYFYTTIINSSGQTVNDVLQVNLDGIGKRDYGYYVDGAWHHFAFKYSANTGVKEIWIDGTCPTGYSKTTGTGYFNNSASAQKDFYFNSSANYLKYFGDLDEMALYKYALHPNMIYKHYQDAVQNHNHYGFNWSTTAPPSGGTVTAGFDIDEFGPGHPNYNVNAGDQLKSFPTPRYKPGHTLLPNFNWMDQAYFGGLLQPSVSYTQAVANSLVINLELAKNYNFNLPASQNTSGFSYYNDVTKFSGAWVNQCNQNPQYPCAAITFWAQINPSNIGKKSTGAYISSLTLPANYYLRNGSGQFIDPQGNVSGGKYWSPASPLDSVLNDGLTQRFYLQSLLSSLTRPLNFINDNGEVIPLHQQNAMSQDPLVVSDKNSTGLDWLTYLGNRKKRVCSYYRDQFMSLSGLANTKYSEYQICGQPNWSHKFSETRTIQTPINGMHYSTPDFYVRYPNNWRVWQSAWHGWQWIVDSRNYEIPLGDKYFSPFVAAGWDNDEEKNVRPAQYLGLLKCLSMVGAEFFYPGFFNLSPPYANPAGYAWQAVMPALSQGITSRYEDLFRNGYVMNGDIPNDYINPTLPGYTFKCGDLRKLIVVRKSNTNNRYAITGTVQPNNSMIGGAELVSNAYITLDGQTVKFKVRRQGSTYIYDKTNTSAPVFYQLDEWHENKHPYKWTKDFNIEAELFDNTNANAVIKTTVPNGTPAGDYTTYTTAVTFTSVSSLVYTFTPRGLTPVTYYLWVRMRSKDGTSAGLTTQLDNNATQLIDCVKDTNWKWYRVNASSLQPITYTNLALQNHTLTLTPTGTKLEIDKITISTSTTTYPGVVNTCSAVTANITASGTTALCQGGSVTLTANTGTSYLWSNGLTTQSIVVSTAGNYSVTVTSPLGTATSSPVTVTVNPLPTAFITAGGPTTFASGGSVTLTASAGTSYLWLPGNQTSQAITVNASGSYTVRVTNSSGCSATSSPTIITVTTSSATITANGPLSFCQGGSVVLTASSGSSFSWSNGATTQSVTVSTSGSYSCTIGGSGVAPAKVVTVNALPVSTITANGSTNICQGSTVTLTATSGTSYLWSNGAVTQSITTGTQGSYNVRVTNSIGCSATSSNTNVIVNALPTATITAGGATTFCQGGSVNLTSSAGSGYLWTPGGQTTQTINVTTGGAYSVKVTNASGCSANSVNTTVTINPIATPTITASGPVTFASGGSVTLTSSAGTSYLWSPGGQTTQSKIITASGFYTVRITNSSGCSATSTPTVVTVTTGTAKITANGPLTFCQGGYVLLTASAGSSYTWTNGATTQSITVTTSGTYGCVIGGVGTASPKTVTVRLLPDATITTNGSTSICQGNTVKLKTTNYAASYLWSNGETTMSIITGLQGAYNVTVTKASGCSATSTFTYVTVNPLPVATIAASGPTTFASGGSVTLTSSTGTAYRWKPNNKVTQAITVTASGSYTVRVTNSNGCSQTSSPVVVNVTTGSAYITAGGPLTFCQGGSVVLTASPGSSYNWSNGANSQSITVTTSGSYSCVIGGVGTAPAQTVTVNPLPVATITPSGPTIFCSGSVALTASSGSSYLWSPGNQTSQSITTSTTGNYTVRVTGSNGCSKVSSITSVTANSLPIPVITTGGAPTTFCQGGNVTLFVTGGTSYVWHPNGQNASAIFINSSGTYSVTAYNGSCSATSAPVVVTVTNCTSCLVPTSLTTTNITRTRASLVWGLSNVADTFEVKLQNMGTNAIATGKFVGTTHSVYASGLTGGQTYNWWVRSICGTTYTAWSSTAIFTTPWFRNSFDVTDPVNEPFTISDTPPLHFGLNTQDGDLITLYPNPANENTTISIRTSGDLVYYMELTDFKGKLIMKENYNWYQG